MSIIKEALPGYVWLVPYLEPTAEIVVDALGNWFSTFGISRVWVSDQGSHFRNKIVDGLRRILQAKHRFTHLYCAWSNGTVERVSRELLRLLRVLFSEHPRESTSGWPQFIRMCQLILNGTYRRSIGTIPMKTVICKDDLHLMKFSRDEVADVKVVTLHELREWHRKIISESIRALDELHTTVVEKRKAERLANSKAHNTRTKVVDVQFAIGDFVLVGVADSVSRPRHVPKLAVRWQGPCRVVRLDSNTIYEIENLVDGPSDVFHYSQIRIYSDDSLHVSELLTTEIASSEQRMKEYKIEKLLDPHFEISDLHFENKLWKKQVQ
jgi:hypothetical protein